MFTLLLLPLLFSFVYSQYGIIGNTCSSTSTSQEWIYDVATGQLSTSTQGYCLTTGFYPPNDGTSLYMAPCVSSTTTKHHYPIEIFSLQITPILPYSFLHDPRNLIC